MEDTRQGLPVPLYLDDVHDVALGSMAVVWGLKTC